MPFLVDSVGMEINRQGLIIALTIHPLIKVARSVEGELQEVVNRVKNDTTAESFLRMEIESELMTETPAGIEAEVRRVLRDVAFTVQDWPGISERVRTVAEGTKSTDHVIAKEEIEETQAFLNWLTDNNFIFLGYREYALYQRDGEDISRSGQRNGSRHPSRGAR